MAFWLVVGCLKVLQVRFVVPRGLLMRMLLAQHEDLEDFVFPLWLSLQEVMRTETGWHLRQCLLAVGTSLLCNVQVFEGHVRSRGL